MPPEILASAHHRFSNFLQQHPFVRVFAMPIILMAAILLGLFLAMGNTPIASTQVVALFILASGVVVTVAIIAEMVTDIIFG